MQSSYTAATDEVYNCHFTSNGETYGNLADLEDRFEGVSVAVASAGYDGRASRQRHLHIGKYIGQAFCQHRRRLPIHA